MFSGSLTHTHTHTHTHPSDELLTHDFLSVSGTGHNFIQLQSEMSVSSKAICLKHSKINMRNLWLCVLGLPVGEEPGDTAAQRSSLSGFVGHGIVITLHQEDRVSDRPQGTMSTSRMRRG